MLQTTAKHDFTARLRDRGTDLAAIQFPRRCVFDANPSDTLREKSRRGFLPFTIYGMNALFIFAFSGLIAKMLGFIKFSQGDAIVALKTIVYAPIKALPITPANQSLVFAILFNAAMFAIAWFMWKKKWFVKV